MRVLVAALFTVSLILFGTSVATRPAGPINADATVTITGVVADHSSVKISYAPVPGAADYRVMDVANPGMVKYAGLIHHSAGPTCDGSPACPWHFRLDSNGQPAYPYTIDPGTGPVVAFDAPALSIELNAIEDEQPHTVIIQAVSQLGPVPPANLYDTNNAPIPPPMPMGTPRPGGNMGMANDGLMSINGQGPDTSQSMTVIAQSINTGVQADPNAVPIPSGSNSTQGYLDTFADAEQQTLSAPTISGDNATYSLNQGTAQAAHIRLVQADVIHSHPFIMQGHFMDVLFDGKTPPSNALHNGYGGLSFIPDQSLDFTGAVLHATMEVDGHFSDRRWVEMDLAPPGDPITAFTPGSVFSNSDQALRLQIHGDLGCDLEVYSGTTTTKPPHSTGNIIPSTNNATLWGAPGQAPYPCDQWNTTTMNGGGLGYDNRTRLDLFVSQTHVAFFQDGRLVQQSDIPGGMPFSVAQAAFSHIVYHTALGESLMLQNHCYPSNAFLFNDPINGTTPGTGPGQDACGATYPPGFGFRDSDERHWSAMGMEVLPLPTTDWVTAFSPLTKPL